MIKKLLLILFFCLAFAVPSHAFWIWTPESGKWTNPKYTVKDTPKTQLAYALGFFQAKEYKKAADELQKLLKNYPRAREAADAQYYLGRVNMEQGQFMAAFKNYQIVIEKYPFSERSGEVVKRQYDIAMDIMEGKQKRNTFVKTVVGGDYDVVEILRAVIKNAPYGEYAAPAQYKIGLFLLEKQMYPEARDEFEKTMNDYPDSEWAKAAKFQIALSDSKRSSKAQYDQKVTTSALNEFKDFVKQFPEAGLSQKAQSHMDALRSKEAENMYVIAQFYEKQKQYDSAKIYYNTIVDKYSNTLWSPKALESLRRLEKK
jgi:outer membrane assembly lipoprotein YfiO